MDHDERKRRNYRAGILAAIGLFMLVGLPVLAFRGSGKNTLTGRVMYRGQPVLVGTVVAVAADGTARSAKLDAEGRYEVTGLPNGLVRLGVISHDPAKSLLKQQKIAARSDRLTAGDRGPTAEPRRWFAVPMHYEDPQNSGFEVILKGAQALDIEMR